MKVVSGSDPQQQLNDGVPFPYIFEANDPSLQETLQWVQRERALIEEQLLRCGTVLFRGFGLESPSSFNDFVGAFGYTFEEFIGGGGPRAQVVGNVFTSTESPPSHTIPFHHELAYLSHYPSKLAFYCDVEPQKDGETPILLSTKLYNRIAAAEPEFLKKITEKKVRYMRVLASKFDPSFKNSYQRGWEEIFETEDKEMATQRAKQTGTDTVEWLSDGSMKVVSVPFDPVLYHPTTGKPSWFNSVVLLHPCIYGASKDDKPWLSEYADGTQFEESSILKINSIMEEEKVALKWRKGDVLLIDNYAALHSRNPFTPPRRILVSMFK